MDPISEEIVEATWKAISAFSPAQAKHEMMHLGKRQPYLVGFVLAYIEALEREVAELAIYIFFVICRIFETASAGRIKKIGAQKVIRAYDQNEAFLERLERAHEKFIEGLARLQSSKQPYLMKYLVEALIEAPESEDPVPLTEEDIGTLYLVLKTVVDVLDEASEPVSRESPKSGRH